MNLTELETKVLSNWEINTRTIHDLKDDNASWEDAHSISESTGIKLTVLRGVVSSLIKKGLIANEGRHWTTLDVNQLLVLTDEGIDVIIEKNLMN